MMTMSKFHGPTLAALLVLMSSPVSANPPVPVTPYYAKFMPSDADLAQIDDDDDKQCIRRANMMNYAGPSLGRCMEGQNRRLLTRVRVAYAGALMRLPTPRRQALQREQRNWDARHVALCKDQLGILTGEANFAQELPYLRCLRDDAYRRAIWLERLV
jgi:uncharacterized protein YecT (DUF1311 family)